jgi:ZIP family zinc transporter
MLTGAGLLAGTLVYVGADAWLTRDEGMRLRRRMGHAMVAGREMSMPERAKAAEGEVVAAGIFVDGVPESVALGLTIAAGGIGMALLAGVLVGNVVEAYGSAHLMVAGGRRGRYAVTLLTAIGMALALPRSWAAPCWCTPARDHRHGTGGVRRRGARGGLDRDHPAASPR